jgi:hypothetical protein
MVRKVFFTSYVNSVEYKIDGSNLIYVSCTTNYHVHMICYLNLFCLYCMAADIRTRDMRRHNGRGWDSEGHLWWTAEACYNW